MEQKSNRKKNSTVSQGSNIGGNMGDYEQSNFEIISHTGNNVNSKKQKIIKKEQEQEEIIGKIEVDQRVENILISKMKQESEDIEEEDIDEEEIVAALEDEDIPIDEEEGDDDDNNDGEDEDEEENDDVDEEDEENNNLENQSQHSIDSIQPHKYFCKECRKIVIDNCDVDGHEEITLIPYEQLKQDFKKYKLYQEQNDPLYNIQKALLKIKETLQHIAIPALQADFKLKQKIFKSNSRYSEFFEKIIYKNNKLLIDDLHLLPNLDELKREVYLIDMINKNYQVIKSHLFKHFNPFRVENMSPDTRALMPKSRGHSQDFIHLGKRRSFNFTEDDQYQWEGQTPQKKLKPLQLQQQQQIQQQQQSQHQNDSHASSIKNIEQEEQKFKKPAMEAGLEHMLPKEREILQNMYNTKYEKHHHFTEMEKKMFAKFALLRKIKDGITVSVTTEQWRLNRITVQIWLDKYKKMLNQKHEA